MLTRRAGHRPRRAFERRQTASGLVLDVALEAAAGADAGHGWGFEDEDEGILDCAHLLAEIAQDARLGQAAAMRSSNGCEADEDDAGVRCVGERGAVEADELDGMRDARAVHDDFGGAADDLVGAPQRRSRRQLEDRDEIGAVELRDEARRRRRQALVGDVEKPGIHDDENGADADQIARQPRVAVRQGRRRPS